MLICGCVGVLSQRGADNPLLTSILLPSLITNIGAVQRKKLVTLYRSAILSVADKG